MSILFEHLNKEKNLPVRVGSNLSLIKSPQSKNKTEIDFIAELKSNLRYRKKKVDEFFRIDKISSKPPIEYSESNSYSSEKNKKSIKKPRKSFLKLDYKKIIEKKSKTLKKKTVNNKSVLPELELYQKKVVNFETERLKKEETFIEIKPNQSFLVTKIKVKEAAQAIYYAILTKNQQIFENFRKRIKGINKDFENLLLKVYKNCFDLERYDLSFDAIYERLNERLELNEKILLKSSTCFYQKMDNLKPELKYNMKFSSTYSAERPKKTFSYNRFYKFQSSRETFEVPQLITRKPVESKITFYNTRSGFTINGKGQNKAQDSNEYDQIKNEDYKLHRKVMDSKVVNREINMVKSEDNCDIGRKTEQDWLVIKKSKQENIKKEG